jgi:hypothetical protein
VLTLLFNATLFFQVLVTLRPQTHRPLE